MERKNRPILSHHPGQLTARCERTKDGALESYNPRPKKSCISRQLMKINNIFALRIDPGPERNTPRNHLDSDFGSTIGPGYIYTLP